MAEKKIKLSVAIATYNEAHNIEACLSSILPIADEIVLVDGGSHDATVSLARKFHARIIETNNPPIFHINKQKALEASLGEWILQLDADEVIPENLREEIVKTIHDETQDTKGFFIARRNYFWGHFMKKGGQYPDYVIRLVKRGVAAFPCKSVHEQIKVEGSVGYLKHPMLHYSYKNRSDYWKKADSYTSLTAAELREKALSPVEMFLNYFFIKPVLTFLSIYIRHKGFMDGLVGLEFSLYSALHYPMAYKKYLFLKNEK